MANITQNAFIRFSNERVRVMADILAKAHYMADALVNDWNAQNISSLVAANVEADQLLDGSATDGRPRITLGDVNSIIELANALVTDNEALNKDKLNKILKVKVNS